MIASRSVKRERPNSSESWTLVSPLITPFGLFVALICLTDERTQCLVCEA
jgi:hypothetical protein